MTIGLDGTAEPPGAGGGGSANLSGSSEENELEELEPPAPGTSPRATSVPEAKITISDRRLWVNGEPFLIRGVCWNPVRAGSSHPEGLDFAGSADIDVALMAELGVNVVRTYEPLLDSSVLDRLWQSKIYVINSVYPWGGAAPEDVVQRVRVAESHPAMLMWAIGNEWNYNGLYAGLSASCGCQPPTRRKSRTSAGVSQAAEM